VCAQELEIADLHGMTARDLADDARHGIGVPAAVERRPWIVDVDPVECRREPVRVALAAHLAVGDDVEPGALLIADREHRRIVLGLLEIARVDPPQLGGAHAGRKAAPQALSIDQPVGLRV
jgi:hypothetical protein